MDESMDGQAFLSACLFFISAFRIYFLGWTGLGWTGRKMKWQNGNEYFKEGMGDYGQVRTLTT